MINHEGITHKSSSLDYCITNYLFIKTTFDDTFLKLSMDTQGIFDSHSVDAPYLAANYDRLNRGNLSEEVWVEHKKDEERYKVLYRRYYLTVRLNHGLARTTHCLPSDTLLTLRFHRAKSSFALLKLKPKIRAYNLKDLKTEIQLDYSYPEDVIPIKKPTLAVYYAFSPKIESTMNRIRSSSIEIPFYDYNCRRIILDEGLSSYDIDLMQGKLPDFYIFLFGSLDRLNGSEMLSLTRYEQGDLTYFDLQLDHESILGYPLYGQSIAAVPFFHNYLKQTNRFDNPYSAG